MDVKVVKYCRLHLESWTGLGTTRGRVGEVVGSEGVGAGGSIVGIFYFFFASLFSKGEKSMSSPATFPAAAATREFLLQTCEYRSESRYITGSSALDACRFLVDGTS